jgi:hypothetical protein
LTIPTMSMASTPKTLSTHPQKETNHAQNHFPPPHPRRLPWAPSHRLHRQTTASNPHTTVKEPQRAWHPLGEDRNWGTDCPRVGKMLVKKTWPRFGQLSTHTRQQKNGVDIGVPNNSVLLFIYLNIIIYIGASLYVCVLFGSRLCFKRFA